MDNFCLHNKAQNLCLFSSSSDVLFPSALKLGVCATFPLLLNAWFLIFA